MPTFISADEAAALIPDDAIVTVSSSSGLGCPDAVLAAIGKRFGETGHPGQLTTLHPIAAGDMYGIKGIDHIAREGLLSRVIGGSYPSGPSSSEPPEIWKMIGAETVAAYNVPSGILFDMHREAAAKRPGVFTKVGLDTFVDPRRQGCAMNDAAAKRPIVRLESFEGEDWLFFKSIVPKVAIIRATTADERGNLTYEHEGAFLGPLDQAMAVHNNGGIVIAQVKRVAEAGTLKPQSVYVPGILVDHVVVAPDQWQTTQTVYDPAISGEIFRPLSSFRVPAFDPAKVIARRVAMELKKGWACNIGFGISANVPRILLEEGRHGDVTWVIEQGAVGGVPLLDFAFGCASNAEAIVPSPYNFTYFQAGGFDCSLLSFLQIDRDGCVNVSKLSARPHVTAGAGGFVDITARAKKIVFSGYFNAGAKLALEGGSIRIEKEGKIAKLVPEVEHVSFSGRRAVEQGQDITYVTERCVLKLTREGVTVTELAPGIDLERDVLAKAEFPLKVSKTLSVSPERLYWPDPIGLDLGRLMSPRIKSVVEGHIAVLTLDRPEKLNALDGVLIAGVEAWIAQTEADLSVRAAIVTGAGTKAFSAGGDITAWAGLDSLTFGREWIRDGHRVFDRLARLRQPLIAVLNGHAFGGGLELAACADFIIVEQHARLGLPETGLGMVPGWSGTQRLVRRFGSRVVKRMTLAGRVYDAEGALAAGIVDEVAPSGEGLARAHALAEEILKRGPVAVQVTKTLVNAAEGEEREAALEWLAGSLIANTDDLKEGVSGFREKRPARFEDR